MNERLTIPPLSLWRRISAYGVLAIGICFALYMVLKGMEANKLHKDWLHEQEIAKAKIDEKRRAAALAAAAERKKKRQAAAATQEQKATAIAALPALSSESFVGTWSGSVTVQNLKYHQDVHIRSDLSASVSLYMTEDRFDKDNFRACYKGVAKLDIGKRGVKVMPEGWIWTTANFAAATPMGIDGSIDLNQEEIKGMLMLGSTSYGKIKLTRARDLPVKSNGCSI